MTPKSDIEIVREALKECAEFLDGNFVGMLKPTPSMQNTLSAILKALLALSNLSKQLEQIKECPDGHHYESEYNGCPVCAMKEGLAIRISDLEKQLEVAERMREALKPFTDRKCVCLKCFGTMP